jgi:hypothetical protein
MIFVASPYTDENPEKMELRYHQVRNWTFARIQHHHEILFSPIAYCHRYALMHNMPTDFSYWQNFSNGFLDVALSVYVLMLPGWEDSRGVTSEIAYAKKLKKKIDFHPYTWTL